MDSEERAHLLKLQKAHIRRLRVMELKWARKGDEMPAGEIVEILDLRDTVKEIDSKLSNSTDNTIHPEQSPSGLKTKMVEVILRDEYKNWKPEIQDAVKRALADIMGISVDQITILSITPGSVKILLEVPAESAEEIFALFRANDPILQELGVIEVRNIEEVRKIEDAIEIKKQETEEEKEGVLDKLIIGLIMFIWVVSKILAVLWFAVIGYILIFQPDWPLWVRITVILVTVINALAHGGSGNSSPPPSSPSPPSPQTPEELVDEEEKKYRELQKKKIYK